jgi:hypothetical protein
MFEDSTLWPARVPLAAGESFASWFCRLAWSHGLTAGELYGVALPGGRMFRFDLDRLADRQLIAGLSVGTGIAADEIESRTFRHWAPTIYGDDDGLGRLRWLPTATIGRHRSSFGQQICPDCLAAPGGAQLSMEWRLGFVHSCPVHRRLLIDRCPGCGSPIQPLAAPVGRGRFDLCVACGGQLGSEAADPTSLADLTLQASHLRVAETGQASLGAYGALYPLAYFEILRLVHRLLATGRFALALRRRFPDMLDDRPESIPRLKEIDRLPPRARRTLLRIADHLLQEWPDRFVAACEALGIHARVLIKDKAKTPFAFWDPVVRHLSAPEITVPATDILAAKRALLEQGRPSTYRELRTLLGAKFATHPELVEPHLGHRRYGSGRYWKLDGVSPQVRQSVKAAAAKSGESIGGWVDRTLGQALAAEHFAGRG